MRTIAVEDEIIIRAKRANIRNMLKISDYNCCLLDLCLLAFVPAPPPHPHPDHTLVPSPVSTPAPLTPMSCLRTCWSTTSVTSLGYFWKVLVSTFPTKVMQKLSTYWEVLWKKLFNLTNAWLPFGQLLVKLGFWMPTSGHTEYHHLRTRWTNSNGKHCFWSLDAPNVWWWCCSGCHYINLLIRFKHEISTVILPM